VLREITATQLANKRLHAPVAGGITSVRYVDLPAMISMSCYFQNKKQKYFQWSELLATDPEVWVRFLALPDFLRSSVGCGTGSTQPREYN
jgi:hypothetical protein